MATVDETMALGWSCYQAGDVSQAEQLFRQVLQIDPGHVDAWYLCGVACQVSGKLEDAVASYRQALRLRPQFAEVLSNLGVALAVQGQYAEAVPCYQQALALKPDLPAAYNNLGIALTELGRLDEAVAVLRQVLLLRPNYAEACYNLGNALQKGGKFEEAVAAYRQAIRLKPDYGEAINNLGAALTRQGILDEAVTRLQEARAYRPKDADVLSNLGNALKEQGKINEALSCYRQALSLQPGSASTHSNYLVCLNYDPRTPQAALFEEHRRWDRRHGHVANTGPPSAHDRRPERRLRVGYVSPDLYHHAAAGFVEPILTHHDPRQVETFCYAEVSTPDTVTARLRSQAHHWRSTFGLSDTQTVDLIRADGIDILVDLAGHTAHNRLGVFAYRPAPVQITYLGYPNTTGLRTMDYRLTDAVADPPGEPACHTEELIRLPQGFCCYAPPKQSADVGPLPAASAGYVTFGSLQNLAKLNADVLDLWCAILRSVPSARLLVFRHTVARETQEHFQGQFARRGIASTRVRFQHSADDVAAGYLGVYRAVDISLDAFPWSGHTTACESLWMGVPVLTLYGDRHAGRMAASVLQLVGLSDWVARTPQQFVDRAVQLAGDLDRLAALRARMRGLVRESALCDGRTFTQGLEQVLRSLWRRWCARREK